MQQHIYLLEQCIEFSKGHSTYVLFHLFQQLERAVSLRIWEAAPDLKMIILCSVWAVSKHLCPRIWRGQGEEDQCVCVRQYVCVSVCVLREKGIDWVRKGEEHMLSISSLAPNFVLFGRNQIQEKIRGPFPQFSGYFPPPF